MKNCGCCKWWSITSLTEKKQVNVRFGTCGFNTYQVVPISVLKIRQRAFMKNTEGGECPCFEEKEKENKEEKRLL